MDRNGSDRSVPHLPFCAPPVSASRGAVPTPQVWHSAQREHGEEHPLQLPRHAPVHGQIQPEGGGGRHHEPEDRVSSCSLFTLCRPLSSSIHSLPLGHFFRQRNSCNSFKRFLKKKCICMSQWCKQKLTAKMHV